MQPAAAAAHCMPLYHTSGVLQVQIWYSGTFLGVDNKSNVAVLPSLKWLNVGVCVCAHYWSLLVARSRRVRGISWPQGLVCSLVHGARRRHCRAVSRVTGIVRCQIIRIRITLTGQVSHNGLPNNILCLYVLSPKSRFWMSNSEAPGPNL